MFIILCYMYCLVYLLSVCVIYAASSLVCSLISSIHSRCVSVCFLFWVAACHICETKRACPIYSRHDHTWETIEGSQPWENCQYNTLTMLCVLLYKTTSEHDTTLQAKRCESNRIEPNRRIRETVRMANNHESNRNGLLSTCLLFYGFVL